MDCVPVLRNPNIEVLRVFLMLSIVFDHCAAQGYFADNLFAYGLAVATTYAVDTFAFISGWYSIRFSVRKMTRLLFLGAFCSVLLFLLSKLALGYWRFALQLGWFGNAYLGLMILAPFVNAGVETIPKRVLLLVWGVFAVLMMCIWLPLREFGIDIVPVGWGPQTVASLLFMYLTGRISSASAWVASRGVRFWGVAAFVSWLAVQLTVVGVHFLREYGIVHECFLSFDASSYASPLNIVCAVSLFMFFSKVRFPAVLGRLCAFLGPSMFGVYLLHSGCHKAVSRVFIARFEAVLGSVLIPGPIGIVINLAVTAVVVFVVCSAIDVARRSLLAVVLRRVGCVGHAKAM